VTSPLSAPVRKHSLPRARKCIPFTTLFLDRLTIIVRLHCQIQAYRVCRSHIYLESTYHSIVHFIFIINPLVHFIFIINPLDSSCATGSKTTALRPVAFDIDFLSRLTVTLLDMLICPARFIFVPDYMT
jgi:hypothetical protein